MAVAQATTTALILQLAQEPPYAADAAVKRKKTKKKSSFDASQTNISKLDYPLGFFLSNIYTYMFKKNL